jgi:thiamine-monophosphate kinase
MTPSGTDITSIGEFGLIERIRRIVEAIPAGDGTRGNLLKGISDDAAVYRPAPGTVQLLTTDAFAEGIHFDLTFTSLKHLGWKIMAANFSDIAAMGGVPRYATIALALPQKISVEMIDDLYAGIAAACRKYGCIPVGGDTTASAANMMISVTVAGEAPEHAVRYRGGARPGEYLCVTGHLGASIAGLKILRREKETFLRSGGDDFTPNLEPYAAAIERHLVPKPRLDLSALLTGRVNIGALIDISDGLASEVHHLCAASGTGASVFEHNLPVESITQKIAAEFGDSPTDYALYGGEEYELLFTISDAEYEKLDRLTNDVSIIGRMTETAAGIQLVREQGEPEALAAGGWDHFAAKDRNGNQL